MNFLTGIHLSAFASAKFFRTVIFYIKQLKKPSSTLMKLYQLDIFAIILTILLTENRRKKHHTLKI